MKGERMQSLGRLFSVVAMGLMACSPPGGTNPAGTGKSVSKSIGSAGGTIELEQVKLTVGPNIVPSDLNFTITSSPNAAASNFTAHSPIYVFAPNGQDFATPITVEFDVSGKTLKNPVVYWTRKGTAVFERRPSTVNGSKVSAQVSHFSMGFVGEATMSSNADSGVPAGNFTLIDGDPAARGEDYIAMAIDPRSGKIGVVYTTPRGTEMMTGHPDFDIKYLEVVNGVASAPETIRYVQRKIGVAIAFDPMGRAVVSYLGGAQGFIQGMSIFWFQSDSVVNVRSGPGMWTETIVTTDSQNVVCGNPVSDIGFLVGLYPGLAFDSTGRLYLAYRDTHNGQFPQQDWAGSDVEVIEDVLGTRRLVGAACGGNVKQAWGGRLKMVMGPNDQPAILYDKAFGGADTTGTDLLMQRREANGNWTSPALVMSITDTMTGGSFAYHPNEGWGVAVTDRSSNKLFYRRNPAADAPALSWEAAQEVFATGTGGWYPSLALDVDPMFPGEPSIAYYVCSPRDGVPASECAQDQDELRIARRSAGVWREVMVDRAGAFAPQLGFLPNGKRVVVYRIPAAVRPDGMREPTAGAVRIAIEK
jgi:hypothetical protein